MNSSQYYLPQLTNPTGQFDQWYEDARFNAIHARKAPANRQAAMQNQLALNDQRYTQNHSQLSQLSQMEARQQEITQQLKQLEIKLANLQQQKQQQQQASQPNTDLRAMQQQIVDEQAAHYNSYRNNTKRE